MMFAGLYTALGASISLAQSALSISDTNWSASFQSGYVFNLGSIYNLCSTGDVAGNGSVAFVCVDGSGGTTHIETVPSATLLLTPPTSGSTAFTVTTAQGTFSTGDASLVGTGDCAVADFDGDGRSDLACFAISAEQPQYTPTVWFSDGTGFSAASTVNSSAAFEESPVEVEYGNNPAYSNEFGPSCTVGHFMAGPGQEILCNVLSESNSVITSSNYYIWRFQGSGYSPSAAPASVQETVAQWTGPSHILTWGPYANFGSDCQTGDFSGSGLTDVACPDGNGNWDMGISTGTGFVNQVWSTSDGVYHKDCITGDINGDGLADIACYVDGAANPINVYLSTGSRFQTMQNWTFSGTNINGGSFSGQSWSGAGMPPPQNPDAAYGGTDPAYPTARDTSIFSTVCSTADLNGDGKTDIICYSNNSSSTNDWVYALSNGSGFTAGHLKFIIPPSTEVGLAGQVISNTMPFEYSCALGSFTVSGLPDIICNPSSYSNPYVFSVGLISRP